MKYIKPKNNNAANVDWLISERVRAIVKTYAEFTEYNESEIVDTFLLNILGDKDFIKWVQSRRNNKRIIKQLQIEDLMESDNIG